MPEIVDVLKKAVIRGLGVSIGKLAGEFTDKYTGKYVPKSGAIVPLALGVAIEKYGAHEMIPEGEELVDGMEAVPVAEYFDFIVLKKPYCVAKDANTIKCYNFEDLENATVIIDGTQLTSGTDFTVSGDEIQLTNALAEGDHDIVVIDGTKKKSFSGKIHV